MTSRSHDNAPAHSSAAEDYGCYYDIDNEPLLGTHTLRMDMQEVRKISPYFAHLSISA